MPSTKLTSRFWSGSEVVVNTTTQDSQQRQSLQHVSSKTAPGDRAYILGNGAREDQDLCQFQRRHKGVTEAQSRHCTTPSVLQVLPFPTPGVTTTEAMKAMATLPVRRAWRNSSDLASLGVSQLPVMEAITLYERGDAQSPDQQCPRCQRGEGAAPECVKIPYVHNGVCSNCIIARACSHQASVARTTRSYSVERRFISAAISRSVPKEDLIAVWNLIAGVIAAQPQECFLESETEPPGKRIEDAARLVARSADEWGHAVEEEGPGSSGTPKTPEEKEKLVRQASRIRKTALQIANCAKEWGEKLERKRSSS
ncbi:hypothetical protein LZ32DRAFT_112386 [Colletotrichum eremochloae]|nr:hypothetical protein LZ32DRAFT_112386 [Colletotrichum eremochloae]